MQFTKLEIPLNSIVEEDKIVLLDVKPIYVYKDSKKTDIISGYKYDVIELQNFEKFSVRIEEDSPTITKEDIDNASVRLKVQFENCIVRPYQAKTSVELSFKADAIFVVD